MVGCSWVLLFHFYLGLLSSEEIQSPALQVPPSLSSDQATPKGLMYAGQLTTHACAGPYGSCLVGSSRRTCWCWLTLHPGPDWARAASLGYDWRTCLCWLMRGISMSWLGEAISCRRCGVEAEAFCLLRHMHTRKKRQAMTRGMAMLGTKMYRIPILLPSRGPGNHSGEAISFQKTPPFQL